jgi:hypothetical protein
LINFPIFGKNFVISTVNTPTRTLPIDIHVNKRYVGKKILIDIGAFAFFAIFTWVAIQYFEDGEPFRDPRIIVFPLAAVAFAISAISRAIVYRQKSPLLALTRAQIQVFEKIFEPIGPVSWQDLIGFREIAVSGSERRMVFYAKNTAIYADRIIDAQKRKKFLKASQHHNDGLLWVDMGKLDYPPTLFKELVQGMLTANQVSN